MGSHKKNQASRSMILFVPVCPTFPVITDSAAAAVVARCLQGSVPRRKYLRTKGQRDRGLILFTHNRFDTYKPDFRSPAAIQIRCQNDFLADDFVVDHNSEMVSERQESSSTIHTFVPATKVATVVLQHSGSGSGNGGKGDDTEGRRLPEEDDDAGPLMRGWEWYMEELHRRPLWTKVWSSAIIFAFGDFLAQMITYFRDKPQQLTIEPRRLGIYAIFGGFVSAPLLHSLYELMDHVFPMPEGNLFKHGPGWRKGLITHLLLDQLFIEITWLIAYFITTGLLEGRKPKDLQRTLKRDLKPTIISAWKIWPALQLFNFGFVPVKNRVLVISLLDVGWTAYLSLFTHGNAHGSSSH